MILEKGVAVITSQPEYFTNENMYLVEEFFYAACEMGALDWADFFLDIVRARFGKSVKVMRMLGVYHEACGEPVKA